MCKFTLNEPGKTCSVNWINVQNSSSFGGGGGGGEGDKNDCTLCKMTPRNVVNFRHLFSCDTVESRLTHT